MKYVTLYPETSNIELVKDVGQIPYNLHRFYNYDTEIVANNIDKNGNNVQYVEDVKLTELSSHKLKGLFLHLAEIRYLLKNARKIDWLNLYHCGRKTLILARLFKFLNPRGKVHLKMDLDLRSCDLYDTNLKERKVFQKNMRIMDLVTVESKMVKDRIQIHTSKEIKVLSDGFYVLPRKDVDQENIFVTAGRIGAKQKATDVLLKAFAQSANKHNWKLKLIGNIDSSFRPYLRKFLAKNPELKDRILFESTINNREKLYCEYAKAKVFVLDSRWESFGLVLPEALSQGCSIIVSDKVPIAWDITNNEKFGKIVRADDVNELAKIMIDMTKDGAFNGEIKDKVEYAVTNYSWKNICQKLDCYLKESK